MVCEECVKRAAVLIEAEQKIDPGKVLYLFTWSPNEKLGPDCDFQLQHHFWVDTIINFLITCSAGAACVEASQMAFPHYHGWYQIDETPTKCVERLICVKVMRKMGNLKITSSIGKYKPARTDYWPRSGKSNCLYYYKKECMDDMLFTVPNCLTRDTHVMGLNWSDGPYMGFFAPHMRGERYTIQDLSDRATQTKYYQEFYRNSID